MQYIKVKVYGIEIHAFLVLYFFSLLCEMKKEVKFLQCEDYIYCLILITISYSNTS